MHGLLLTALLLAQGSDEWTLYRGLVGAGRIAVEVRAPEVEDAARRAAETLAALCPYDVEVVIGAGAPAGVPRIVLGRTDDAETAALAERCGFPAPDEGTGFRFQNRTYSRADEVLVATVEDPDRVGLPLTLYLANSPEALEAEARDLAPVWRRGALVRRGGQLLLRATLADDGAVNAAGVVDYAARRQRRSPPVTARFGPVTLRHDPPAEIGARLGRYGTLLAETRSRAIVQLPGAGGGGPLDVSVFDHAEDMARLHGSLALSSVRPGAARSVTALVAPGIPHDGGACVAQATALQVLGCAPVPAWMLDGVGAALAETWWGWPMADWVAYLHRAGLALDAADLVDPARSDGVSPHRLVPLRGFLFGLLLDELDPTTLTALWRGDEPFVVDDDLERRFRARLDENLALAAERLDERRALRRAALDGVDWQAGVCLRAGGGDVEAALVARDLGHSLDRAQLAGADAVSIVLFAYDEPRPARWAGEPLRAGIDAEASDVAVANAVGEARARGMRTLLAPQLLVAPTGSWTAGGGPSDEEGIAEFFAAYRRFLEHYALLGELLGCEVLCLGNELGAAARTRPRDGDTESVLATKEARREEWKELIADVRRAFSGGLTYAAGVGRESEDVEFWSELDFVGIDFFPPTVVPTFAADRRARSRIEVGLERYLDLAEEAGVPLLLVQTGFPSNRSAAERPELTGGEVDLEQQRRLFELLAEVVTEARERGLAGFYLWRWDPDPRGGGARDTGHTPQGKPAEKVLPRLFGR